MPTMVGDEMHANGRRRRRKRIYDVDLDKCDRFDFPGADAPESDLLESVSVVSGP